MADEQPGHINRDVRDATNVPQAEDLVRDNVGSTVRDNSNFKAVSEAEAAVASTLYLDPSIQAAHTSPKTKKIQNTAAQTATTTTTTTIIGGDTERAAGEEEVRDVGSSEESRPAEGFAVEHPATTAVREGPVVVMSDANNYAGSRSPNSRRKGKRGTKQAKCGTCCVG